MQFLLFDSQVLEPEYAEELMADVQLDDDERELAAKLADARRRRGWTTRPTETLQGRPAPLKSRRPARKRRSS